MKKQEDIIFRDNISDEKTGKIAFRCLECDKISTYPAYSADGRICAHCDGPIIPLGYAKKGVHHIAIKPVLPAPTESMEQQALFEWAAWAAPRFPGLNLMFHIPNGGMRSKSEAGRFKMEGVKAGIPDIFLPVARGGFNGLFIELKRVGGRASPEQLDIIEQLTKQGYLAALCYGFDSAREIIEKYYKEGI